MDDGLRMVEAGACSAWPLPGDPTCAGIARRMFRRVASGLALDPVVVDDGVTMVSHPGRHLTVPPARDLPVRDRQPRLAASDPYVPSTTSQKRSASISVATSALGIMEGEKSVTVIPDVSRPVVSTCTSAGR